MLIWTLSLDGNKATGRQTRALAETLAATSAEGATIRSFHPKPPPDTTDLRSNRATTWTKPLSREELAALGFRPPWPDVVISCRPEVSAIALGIKQISRHLVELIHIQNPNNPNGPQHFDPATFDLLAVQSQEKVSGPNVIRTPQALHVFTPASFARYRHDHAEQLQKLRHPVLTILIGGNDENFIWKTRHKERLAEDIRKMAHNHGGAVLVVTSRRTGEIGTVLHKRLDAIANVHIDMPGFDYEASLAAASLIMITGDSLSMANEAAATGTACILYDAHSGLRHHPAMKNLRSSIVRGKFAIYPDMPKGVIHPPQNILLPLAQQIRERLNLG